MPREDIEFKTCDNVTLRGWFYKPVPKNGQNEKLPCLVISHGWTCLKEMGLDTYAEHFTTNLPISCLVYDQRGIGASDTGPGQHRSEILTPVQRSDLSDAITYAQGRNDVDMNKIGIWGYSYSGGHSIHVAACDRRVKAVMVIAPFIDGWTNFTMCIRPDFMATTNALFREGELLNVRIPPARGIKKCKQILDRLKRAAGEAPMKVPVITDDPAKPAGLPNKEAYDFFTRWEKKVDWKNELTVKSLEDTRANDNTSHIAHIAPTPFLMTVALQDVNTVTTSLLQCYEKALQPKELQLLPGGHFDFFEGANLNAVLTRQTEFLNKTLCT